MKPAPVEPAPLFVMVADSVSSLPTMPGDRETGGAPAVRSGRSETVTEPQLNACDTPAEVTVIVPVFVPEVVYDLVTLIPVPSRLFGLPFFIKDGYKPLVSLKTFIN